MDYEDKREDTSIPECTVFKLETLSGLWVNIQKVRASVHRRRQKSNNPSSCVISISFPSKIFNVFK